MKKTTFVFLMCFSLFFMAYDVVRSQQGASAGDEEITNFTLNRVVKTVDGAQFMVQPDRPIEKVDGIYRPISLEKYFTFKLEKLEKRLNETTAALERKIRDLSKKQEALDQKVKELSRPQIPQASNSTREAAPAE